MIELTIILEQWQKSLMNFENKILITLGMKFHFSNILRIICQNKLISAVIASRNDNKRIERLKGEGEDKKDRENELYNFAYKTI